MQKKQVFNPFLPLNEYIPDGEPHVFGDRVYLFGSHDKEGGYTFCMNDYVVYSAPVSDLSDWKYEGVTYRASQDPSYPNPKYMYAPDVVQGNDGRYYLYYCMGGDYGVGGYSCPISVAVCDSPAGQYEYLGFVKNPDGSPMMKYICFDPAAINDDGVIRIYYGTQYSFEEDCGLSDYLEASGTPFLPDEKCYDLEKFEDVIKMEMDMFGRTREEILSYQDSINGANMLVLEDDMLTVKEDAKHIIPYKIKGTSFEGHPFFEGSSMRKIGNKYYFIYSSWLNHELCYAVSDSPDKDFVFGGTIVSNGDVGLNGRNPEDKLNMTGTTHGSICEIKGQWYVFFHRLTHKSDYSRQACAEKIKIENDGSIRQAELTSCGLNDGPLKAEGKYPAVICCNLTNGHMPHGSNSVYTMSFPNVTNLGEDRFIGEIEDDTLIGYKYFDFKEVKKIGVTARFENDSNRVVFEGPLRVDDRCLEDEAKLHEGIGGKDDELYGELPGSGTEINEKFFKDKPEGKCFIEIYTEINGNCAGRIDMSYDAMISDSDPLTWNIYMSEVDVSDGVYALYFRYHGDRKIQMKEIIFMV